MELNFEKMPRFKSHAMTVLSLVPEWAHAHQVPEEAIKSQVYTAHAWCNSNPKKAPKKNVIRFLWSWMASAKRYGNLKTPQEATVSPSAADADFVYEMSPEEMDAIKRRNFPQRGTLADQHKGAIDTEAIKHVA